MWGHEMDRNVFLSCACALPPVTQAYSLPRLALQNPPGWENRPKTERQKSFRRFGTFVFGSWRVPPSHAGSFFYD